MKQKKDYATAAMTGDEQTRRRIILNDCPVCGARPGNPCVTTRGNQPGWLTNPHRARYTGEGPKTKLPGKKFESALKHPCSRCGAPEGDVCITTRGKKTGQPTWAHAVRRSLAMGMPFKQPVDARVLKVSCPTCGAGPGEKCTTTGGDNKGSPTNTHVDRRRAANVAGRSS